MQIFKIKPILPTIFGDQKFHELRPSDHFLSFSVDTVHIVPGPIETDRFNDALSHALSVYPLYAGSLDRSYSRGSSWKIRLTNTGVPVTFLDVDAERAFPTDAVVQRPLQHVERIGVAKIVKGSSDEALLRILVTRHTSHCQTTIGMSLSHIIGDAHTVTRFQRLISHYYQGFEPPDPAPSYLPFVRCRSSETIPDIPQLRNPYSINAPPPLATDSRGALPELVVVRLTSRQVQALHERLSITYHVRRSTCRISRQDAFCALVAYSISQADDVPIQCIANTVDHRGRGVADKNSAGNVLISTRTEPIELRNEDSSEESIANIAVCIRKSIDRTRDPDHLKAQVVLAGTILLQSAFNEMQYDFAPGRGQMTINSTWRSGWQSADFGYPGRVAFHTHNHIASRYLRVFTPNPVLLPDGTWKEREPGDVEISLALFRDVKAKFATIIKKAATEVGIVDDIEFM